MEDKDKQSSPTGPKAPETRSAFNRRQGEAPPAAPQPEEKPIPSQPRSFSPVRPQRASSPRKSLASAPADAGTPANTEPKKDFVAASPDAPAAPKDKAQAGGGAPSAAKAASIAGAGVTTPTNSEKLTEKTETGSAAATPEAPATGATAASPDATRATSPRLKVAHASSPPQSSGAGGDTIRLRVSPRPQARTLNTAPGRGVRRRLPDIRQGKTTSASGHYGPFSLFFGFLWLIFKMIFFTGLVLGLGALIGFMVMTEYIKTPEVTVPNVSGMKIDEAFDVLSDKKLGVIKRGTESSGLVAPGEIISQQPPAGAKAKVDTDVGVVISSGRAQFVVPNVVNETRENAINKIRGARLEVGNVLTVEDNSVARGNVISQSPIGGTGQDEAVKVDLMISAGPPGKSLTMPDLAGRTVIEAKAALKAVGIDDVVTEPADAAPDAKVVSHDPLVGKTVFQTDKVTLVTSKK
jgi:beta-lactam-binding protein with PASTA domain